jgi:hypothetical protein
MERNMKFYLDDEIADMSKFIQENYPGFSLVSECIYNLKRGREEYIISLNKDGAVWKYASFFVDNKDIYDETNSILLKNHFRNAFLDALKETLDKDAS